MKPKHKPTMPGSEAAESCPVAALMRQVERILQEHERCDQPGLPSEKLSEVEDALQSAMGLATFCQARSLEGIIFQLVLAYHELDSILTGSDDVFCLCQARIAGGTLWLIRDAFASVTGVAPSEIIADFYMKYDRPNAAVGTAVRMLLDKRPAPNQ
jgi:hypothetical protein